ncbi:endolytic transglycosylase MltG [Marinobacterium weihaiense]|uniref:Endolytic murein transglycosylase n=1 Tax=Marinobacterium weihaiense TaxID=2851016 RepID=A0ABS6M7R6_9GAMM|nr:endolytic transglycosylase MltG [Marinobacterium weihaiense]MBV0931832.1 endolytic transglycosylase MltG [Marinobacterium weihaiense]
MLKKFILFCLLLALVLMGAAWAALQQLQQVLSAPLPLAEERVLTVEPGTWFRRFALQLEEEGLVDHHMWLRAEAYRTPWVTGIKAGEYQLEPGLTLQQLLEKVVNGDTINYTFTLVEGSTFKQLKAALLDNDRLKHELDDMSEDQLLKVLGSDAEAVEGLFLAETYHFQRGMTDLQLLKRAHDDLKEVLEAAWQARDKALPYKRPYEALIMASIIEKETGVPSERSEIAGVFVRRLQRGMRLQTDPTVIYGMGERYKGNITRADLRRPTPWNTYVIDGLPPTPIALVGREAITAALNPADGKTLYFVAKGDGSHHFSRSLQEHNRAVRRYQLQRRADYRSSPEN